MNGGWQRGGGGNGGPVIEIPKINFPPRLPRGAITGVLGLLALAVVLLFLWTSFFQVKQDEVGVVLRFGRYVRTAEPGLRFRLPLFIEKVYKVPVARQLKLEFGYRTVEAGQRTRYSEREFLEETVMLTGDLNVAEVEWAVQYRIKDPRAFLFNVAEPEATFRDVSEAVVRAVVGDHSVDEVVTTGRDQVAAQAQALLQETLDLYEMGIDILQLVPQDVNPPEPVKPAFNEVNEAIQEKETLENQAEAEYNRAIPLAEGQAAQLIAQAEGYAQERVNQARGDVARFLAVYEEYRKAPEVTRQRLWLEALSEVIGSTGRRIVVGKDLEGLIPLLNLGGTALPASPRAPQEGQR